MALLTCRKFHQNSSLLFVQKTEKLKIPVDILRIVQKDDTINL